MLPRLADPLSLPPSPPAPSQFRIFLSLRFSIWQQHTWAGADVLPAPADDGAAPAALHQEL